jgi:hypothetical protein
MADAFKLPDISKFSPEEQSALTYHRQNLLGNTALKHDDGSLTTFMGTVVDTDKGAMILPTYWGGAVRDVPDAMRFAIKSGINFPTYPIVKDALKAEQNMHRIMEQDVKAYMRGR